MRFDLRHGDSREVLPLLDAASVDALVTDPPAGIGFMGKDWDTYGRSNPRAQDDRSAAYDKVGKGASPYGYSSSGRVNGDRGRFISALQPIFEECMRVLKPGAHGLVWALPRTSHWTATALEDAGFEIRDVGVHLFGTGFPKSLNLGDGRATALKPASEHWILVRRPLDGTVAANVAAHGTGALNIDACRIASADPVPLFGNGRREAVTAYGNGLGCDGRTGETSAIGRWPANVTLEHSSECERVGTRKVKTGVAVGGLHSASGTNAIYMNMPKLDGAADHTYAGEDGKEEIEDWRCAPGCPVAILDRQSGDVGAFAPPGGPSETIANVYSGGPGTRSTVYHGDSGGASRFFYVAKPDRSERDIGCEDLPAVSGGTATDRKDGSAGTQNPRAGAGRNGGARNIHPTVKSVDLMRWLCRLVTPRGGLVLDPFMGSGSTGIACAREGMRFIGIERERAYFEIARRRIVGDAPLLNRIGQLQLEGPEKDPGEAA